MFLLKSSMLSSEEVECEIQEIKKRNNRVEADKAWESSWTRRGIILILTYIIMVIFFYCAQIQRPLINAIVPALAFVLSSISIPLFKEMWLKRIHKK